MKTIRTEINGCIQDEVEPILFILQSVSVLAAFFTRITYYSTLIGTHSLAILIRLNDFEYDILFNLNDDDYAEASTTRTIACTWAREAQRFWQSVINASGLYLLTGIE